MLTGESVTSIIQNNQSLPSNSVCVCVHTRYRLPVSNNAMKSNAELFIPRWYTIASGFKK